MNLLDSIVLAAARQQRRGALHQIDVFLLRSELHLVAERRIHTRRRGYLVRSDPVSRPITRCELAHRAERGDLFRPRGVRPRDTRVLWAESLDARWNVRQRIEDAHELRDLLLAAVLGASHHLAEVLADRKSVV